MDLLKAIIDGKYTIAKGKEGVLNGMISATLDKEGRATINHSEFRPSILHLHKSETDNLFVKVVRKPMDLKTVHRNQYTMIVGVNNQQKPVITIPR